VPRGRAAGTNHQARAGSTASAGSCGTATLRARRGVGSGHAGHLLQWIVLLLAALRAPCRRRGDPIAEHLLLRHQLAVLTRPTRRRPRGRFRRLGTLLLVLVRRVRRDWRRHLFWRWRSRAVGVHAVQALRRSRTEMNIPARLMVCALTGDKFSIADPEDAGMLDVVGFDTATPDLMAAFAKGEV
jgi:hypothetical protein